MEKEIKKIMAGVFFIEESSIADNASPDTIDQWDSMNHLNLIVAIEEAYDIEFTEEQMTEMLNLPLVIEVTRQALEK